MNPISTIAFLVLVSHTLIGQQKGTVDYPYLGVKFTIPENWKGQESDEAYLIASDTEAGLLALIPHEATTIKELEEEAKKGIFEETIFLKLSGSLKKFGAEGIGGEFSGTIEGTNAKAYIIGVINPFGYGVTVLATTDDVHYTERYQKLAEELASSLQFKRPKEPEKNKEWKEWLSGAKLVYMKSDYSGGASYGGYSTYSSYSSRKEILLCKNGSFSFYSSSQSSFDSGGGFGSTGSGDNGEGVWKLEWGAKGSSILKLEFGDGREFAYNLGYDDSKTLLNGSRYFVIHDHNECY